MSMLTTRRLVLLSVAAMVAIALAVPALAQSDESSPDASAGATAKSDGATDDYEGRHAERRAAFVEELATELDLPTEQVDTALTAVREQLAAEHRADVTERMIERLDAAVADGALSQEQADAIAAAAEEGLLGDLRPDHRRWGHAGWGAVGGPDGHPSASVPNDDA